MIYQFIKRLDTESRLGKRIISHIIPEQYRKQFSALYKQRARVKMIRSICADRSREVKDLFHTCLQHIAPVSQPLILISPLPYCGGLFLNQLLDGHPQLHSHPGRWLRQNQWPLIDTRDNPRRWFEMLVENERFDFADNGCGYRSQEAPGAFFLFAHSLQEALFHEYLDSLDKITPRDVFDAYHTSYFGAWLNNQNGSGSKKWITAYTPGISTSETSILHFFEVYPRGRLISIVRDPGSWYAAATRHAADEYADFTRAMECWEAHALMMLNNRKRFRGRVCLLAFEDLMADTAAVMHSLAKLMELEFSAVMLGPTLNTFALKAHSMPQPSDARRSLQKGRLTADRERILERLRTEIYPLVLAETLRMD